VTTLAVRAALVVLAVLILAWLAVGLRAVRLEDQAEATLDRARAGAVSDTDFRNAQDRLEEADDLSPDLGPLITYGQLLEAVGKRREADFVARAVTVDEPDNLQAWYLAYVADPNPASREHALDELLRLNPFMEVTLGLRDCLHCPLKKR
jgi:hypothetical protein